MKSVIRWGLPTPKTTWSKKRIKQEADLRLCMPEALRGLKRISDWEYANSFQDPVCRYYYSENMRAVWSAVEFILDRREGKTKTIWKFILGPATELEMPEGAEILAVQEQRGEVCLWALLNPANPRHLRTFQVYGTGHAMPAEPGTYIGSLQMNSGELVLHVFEAKT